MNQFTIEFKNSKDLAKKISEYNALMNPAAEIAEVLKVTKEETKKAFKEQTEKVEPVKEETQSVVVDLVEETPTPVAVEEVQAVVEVEPEIVEEPTAEPAPPAEETTEPPVTDFDGNPVDPKPAEAVPAVEEANEPIDKKAYWAKFKAWMGEDKERGVKAFKVFAGHGLTKATSDSLTDEIMAELDELMA